MAARETPKRIYIETTALIQLGQKFENVDFEKLLELTESANFRIYISEVSWLEYIRKRKKDLAFFVDSCLKAERVLEKHGKVIPEVGIASDRAKLYLANIEAHYREKAHNRGIEIIPLPSVSLGRLLKMSIECTRPFEEAEDESKEKGFRDSLIMFSILESLPKNSDDSAVVVTQDQFLAEGLGSHAPEYGANILVMRTLDEATTHIVNTLAESERIRIKQESISAIGMLDSYEETIASKIANIRELSDRDLTQNIRWALTTLAERENLVLKGIRSIRFEKTDSAIWKDKDKSKSRILFRCLCRVTLTISVPARTEIVDEPRKFTIGDQPFPPPISVMAGTPATLVTNYHNYKFLPANFFQATEEREFPMDVYGVAELQRAESSLEWELVSINVDKSVPAEEYDALVAAEIS